MAIGLRQRTPTKQEEEEFKKNQASTEASLRAGKRFQISPRQGGREVLPQPQVNTYLGVPGLRAPGEPLGTLSGAGKGLQAFFGGISRTVKGALFPSMGRTGQLGSRKVATEAPLIERERPEVLAAQKTQSTDQPPSLPTAGTPVSGSILPSTDIFPSGETSINIATPPPIIPKTEPIVPFTFEPKGGVIKGEEFQRAQEGQATPFIGRLFEGATGLQQDVLKTRADQPTNIADLERARGAEGYNQARADLEDVNRNVADFNVKALNLERVVRERHAGGVATESQIQAEIETEKRQLAMVGNELAVRQQAAVDRFDLINQATLERFNAQRADSAEKVNQVIQALGFQTDNINTAVTLMTNLKNYEILTDTQKSQRRDTARAAASLYITTPGAMNTLSSEELAILANEADLSYSALVGIQQNIRTGWKIVGEPNVDDTGNLNVLFFNPNTGQYTTKRWSSFASPKKTGLTSASIAESKLISNASAEARTALKLAGDAMMQNSALSAAERTTAINSWAGYLTGIAAVSGKPADKEIADTFKSTFINPAELTAEEVRQKAQALLGLFPEK